MSGHIDNRLLDIVKTSLSKLYSIWEEIGFDESIVENRSSQVYEHCKIILKRMIEEELVLKDQYTTRAHSMAEKITILIKQLNLDENFKIDQKLGLIDLNKELSIKLDKLTLEKNERIGELTNLRQIENELCSYMKDIKHYKLHVEIPSHEQLADFKEYVKSLELERAKRFDRYKDLKEDILKLFSELEYDTKSELEKEMTKEISHTFDVVFNLTQVQLKDMNELLENLKFMKVERETKLSMILESVKELWDRINLDSDYQSNFVNTHNNLKLSTYHKVEAEYERCQALLKANLENYIGRLRSELKELWEECYVQESAKKKFTHYNSTDYSDELIQVHEAEIQKWKKYLKDTNSIRNMIKERNELWDKMIHLEHQARDVNRFKNRGGNLLKEEKERKRVAHKLPKLEYQIQVDIQEWEQNHPGGHFTYHGLDFGEFIKEQWAEYYRHKDEEKEIRLKAKKEVTKLEMTYGTRPLTPLYGLHHHNLHNTNSLSTNISSGGASKLCSVNSNTRLNLIRGMGACSGSISGKLHLHGHETPRIDSGLKKFTSTRINSPGCSGGVGVQPHTSLKNLQNRQVINRYKKRSSRILRMKGTPYPHNRCKDIRSRADPKLAPHLKGSSNQDKEGDSDSNSPDGKIGNEKKYTKYGTATTFAETATAGHLFHSAAKNNLFRSKGMLNIYEEDEESNHERADLVAARDHCFSRGKLFKSSNDPSSSLTHESLAMTESKTSAHLEQVVDPGAGKEMLKHDPKKQHLRHEQHQESKVKLMDIHKGNREQGHDGMSNRATATHAPITTTKLVKRDYGGAISSDEEGNNRAAGPSRDEHKRKHLHTKGLIASPAKKSKTTTTSSHLLKSPAMKSNKSPLLIKRPRHVDGGAREGRESDKENVVPPERDSIASDSYTAFTSGIDKKDVPFCHSSQMEDYESTTNPSSSAAKDTPA